MFLKKLNSLDSIDKMKELNLSIKEFKKKNKSVIEKDKKI